ncbi:MAG: DUF932 domain-containing protein [Verrucomicrobia bacterium]|jgi:hypothetical protein|nr:DUF932 domain-containing protein [Verrucomicrobiota bacterium]
MILGNQPTGAPEEEATPKWGNSPVTFHEGTLAEIRQYIPQFERRGFGLSLQGNEQCRMNQRLDTIVRLPFHDDNALIPVGVVSKDYALVPHTDVLDVATKSLEAAQIAPDKVRTQLKITEYGERMALSLFLPDEYQFDPGDGHPMALRLECMNSVDGSTRFRALMGWFRFVCSNGLIIGVTRSDMRRRHVGDFRLQDIGDVLTSGLKEADKEKKNFKNWRMSPVTINKIAPWTEEHVRKAWGFKAATRAFHIARTGADAEIAGQYKGTTPTTIPVRRTTQVPGAPKECRTLYDVSQILAWLAKERRDLQEQLEWREAIPELMNSLN